ncbi:MAG: DnaJ domain-containing protein [Nitrospirae bacterium]|nr:DnaJ domain-containing protein [Nitrospirota bacterium]
MLAGERRDFRRYSGVSDLDLKFKKRSYKARITDYSFNGIGAIVTEAITLSTGDMVEFSVTESDISANGVIMWLFNDSSGLRIGIRHVGQLRGMIKDFRLADILIGLQRSNKTGVLTTVSGEINKKIYIKDGDMIFASSNQKEDRLGDLLLKEGMINLDQYNHSVAEMNKTGQRQGAVLVRHGYLKAGELSGVVAHQVEEIILSLFAMDNGFFIFEEGPLPTDEVITLKLSAANLIYNGTKKIESFSRIRGGLPSMDSILFMASDPFDLFQDIKLDETGRRLISLIDNRRSVKEILAAGPSESLEVFRTLYALLSTRLVVIKDASMPNDAAEDLHDIEPEVKEKSAFKDAIEDMHQKFQSLGYYGVLGISRDAQPSEIKSSYYRAAKMYHPDRHFSLTDASLKSKLNDIFTYVYEAYATLSNAQKRTEHDRQAASGTKSPADVRDRARASFEEGKKYLREADPSELERLFGQAVYFDQSVAEYHRYYSLALRKSGKLRNAVKAMEKAITLDQANPDYLAELGLIFLDLGLPLRAKGMFNKALAISPGHETALQGLKTADA